MDTMDWNDMAQVWETDIAGDLARIDPISDTRSILRVHATILSAIGVRLSSPMSEIRQSHSSISEVKLARVVGSPSSSNAFSASGTQIAG